MTTYAIGKSVYVDGKHDTEIKATVSKEEFITYLTLRAMMGGTLFVTAKDNVLIVED